MPQSNRRHLMAVTATGELLEDARAFAINEELMSDKSNAAYDDNREVPLYRQKGKDTAAPVTVSFYSGGSRRITNDEVWLDIKAEATYDAAATSILKPGTTWLDSLRRRGMVVLAVGAIIFIVGGGLAFYEKGQKREAENERQVQTAQIAQAAQSAALESAAAGQPGTGTGGYGVGLAPGNLWSCAENLDGVTECQPYDQEEPGNLWSCAENLDGVTECQPYDQEE